jgi:hypothetical protein
MHGSSISVWAGFSRKRRATDSTASAWALGWFAGEAVTRNELHHVIG